MWHTRTPEFLGVICPLYVWLCGVFLLTLERVLLWGYWLGLELAMLGEPEELGMMGWACVTACVCFDGGIACVRGMARGVMMLTKGSAGLGDKGVLWR